MSPLASKAFSSAVVEEYSPLLIVASSVISLLAVYVTLLDAPPFPPGIFIPFDACIPLCVWFVSINLFAINACATVNTAVNIATIKTNITIFFAPLRVIAIVFLLKFDIIKNAINKLIKKASTPNKI